MKGPWPPGTPLTAPIGHVPQVNHTFAYTEGNYGIMNERQLSIGESTCSGAFVAEAAGSGGQALFCVNELSRLAMERCVTARCAVELMGGLAERYGFYGASGSFEGGSETLLIADTEEARLHVRPTGYALRGPLTPLQWPPPPPPPPPVPFTRMFRYQPLTTDA